VHLKILLTVHQFFPDHRSGTEVLTLGVAQELRRRGHDVRVFAGFPEPAALPDADRFDSYEVEGVRVHRFRHGRQPMGGQTVLTEIAYNNMLAARHFAGVVSEFAPDLVHAFHFSRLGGTLVDVAVKANVPVYYTPTDFWAVCPTTRLVLPDGRVCAGPSAESGNCVKHVAELGMESGAGRLTRVIPDVAADVVAQLTAGGKLPAYPYSREVSALHARKDFIIRRLNWLHAIASPTRMMTDTLLRYGVDPDLIVQLGYGIEMSAARPSPVEPKENEPLEIGFIGTLAPHKGCHVLIDAFRRLPPDKARLRIYGNPADFPEYYADLQRRAGESPAIAFCGAFPREQIDEVLARLHVLVIPSLWNENAPLVMHAALAAKRPVIASDLPGLSETVRDSWNGLLFAAGRVSVLNERLNRVLENRALLSTFSRNCHKPKSLAVYVDELLALYARGPLRDVAKRDYHGLQDIRPL